MEPQEQPKTPLVQPGQNHHRRFIWIFASVALLLLISGFCVWYFQIREVKEVNQIKNEVVDEFADWKTYRNEEYGFEFKYPESWRTSNRSGVYAAFDYAFYPSDENNLSSFVVVVKKDNFQPVEANTKLNGYDAYYNSGDTSYIIQNNNLQIGITTTYKNPIEENEILTILSTFKFVEKNLDNDILVKIYSHGGLCASGEECSLVMTISSDGKIQSDGKSTGTISPADLNKLSSIVNNASYEAMLANKFTGICPIAYDGVQTEYTFYTTKGNYVVDSCKVQIDENWELFWELNTILRKYLF